MKWSFWMKLMRTRKPPASPTVCPSCGEEMIFVEKYTMMGEDQSTYRCSRCRKEHAINFGTAMWKWMSDANNQANGRVPRSIAARSERQGCAGRLEAHGAPVRTTSLMGTRIWRRLEVGLNRIRRETSTMTRFAFHRAILSACVVVIPLIAASAADARVCTEQYAPVCGQVGRITKTYSNGCFARADGAKAIAQGHCHLGFGNKTPK